MKLKRPLLIAGVLLSVAGAGFTYWRIGSTPKEPPFLTVPVSKGNVRQVVSSTGTLQAVTTVLVGSQVSGTITTLSADFNTKVTNGQVGAVLDQSKFKAKLEETRANVFSAQANLAKAKVALEDAERTLKRTRELKGRELVSQSEFDAAQTTYDAARSQVNVTQAQVNQAQASMNQASIDLAYTVIRSPVDGVVISRSVDVGQTVAASLQAPTLFLIANDLSRMQILAAVDEADVGKVKDGMPARFTVDAHPGEVFQGRIREVRQAPTNVQNVVTYAAVTEAPDADRRLRQGMTAPVGIGTRARESAVRVPNLALRSRPPAERDGSEG